MEFPAEQQIRTVLLDIEGTTTPANFVYKTLFPYAERKLENFLQEHFAEPQIEALVRELRLQRKSDERQGLGPSHWLEDSRESQLRSAVEYSRWLMARDSKCSALKALQGAIWQEGYARGALRGEVYPDVPPAFERWRGQGRAICIYSSGSELAQRLLFSSVSSGDLTAYIARYFDTRVGAKAESESYGKIAGELGRAPNEVLFVSDAVREIEAAAAVGMKVALCVRETDVDTPVTEYPVVHTFDQIR